MASAGLQRAQLKACGQATGDRTLSGLLDIGWPGGLGSVRSEGRRAKGFVQAPVPAPARQARNPDGRVPGGRPPPGYP